MIPRQSVGFIALGLTGLLVLRRGRAPERLGIAIVAIGWLLTPLVEQRQSWYRPQFGIMTVDGLILLAFLGMAFRYGRYWTIFVAAFQAVAVLIHLTFLIDPQGLYRAYFAGTFAIGYLILGAIFGGTIIEGRRPYRQRPFPLSRPRSGSS